MGYGHKNICAKVEFVQLQQSGKFENFNLIRRCDIQVEQVNVVIKYR